MRALLIAFFIVGSSSAARIYRDGNLVVRVFIKPLLPPEPDNRKCAEYISGTAGQTFNKACFDTEFNPQGLIDNCKVYYDGVQCNTCTLCNTQTMELGFTLNCDNAEPMKTIPMTDCVPLTKRSIQRWLTYKEDFKNVDFLFDLGENETLAPSQAPSNSASPSTSPSHFPSPSPSSQPSLENVVVSLLGEGLDFSNVNRVTDPADIDALIATQKEWFDRYYKDMDRRHRGLERVRDSRDIESDIEFTLQTSTGSSTSIYYNHYISFFPSRRRLVEFNVDDMDAVREIFSLIYQDEEAVEDLATMVKESIPSFSTLESIQKIELTSAPSPVPTTGSSKSSKSGGSKTGGSKSSSKSGKGGTKSSSKGSGANIRTKQSRLRNPLSQ